MRIGIEARWITFEKTGFGNYAQNLLSQLGQIDSKNRYTIYLNNSYDNGAIFSRPNFDKVVIRRPPEIYKHIYIPLDIKSRKRQLDFFHFLYNAPSLVMPCPFVLTMHDVSYKYIPKMISIKNRISITAQLLLNAKRAKRVISVSESAKVDIVKFYKVSPEKITVIYEGVEDCFRPTKDEPKQRLITEKYELPSQYLLYVGTYLPHKNLETLLRAYQKLKLQLKIPHSLVLAGKKGRNYSSVARMIHELELDGKVRSIGFVPDEDLPYVYNLSDMFIFPSLYEGFGLPILEAMACGVPVVASNSSCLPEIGGGGALYFSPEDVDGLVDRAIQIIRNDNLRRDLRERGLQRAKLFSWRAMAEKTLALYEDVWCELRARSKITW